MSNLTYTFTLTAGQPENVNQLNQNLTDVRTIINGGIDATNITAGSITNTLVSNSAAIAGSKLDTTDGRLQQTTGIAVSSGDLNLKTAGSGVYADVPSATATLTPDVACYALVTSVFEFDLTSVENTVDVNCDGALVVDGSVQTGTATHHWGVGVSGGPTYLTKGTHSTVHRVALTAAAHTLKLQAKYTLVSGLGTGNAVCKATNTRFLYQLVAQ